MKTYLSCILIVLSSSLAAQTLPTQIQTFEWNPAFFDWIQRSSENFQYDDRDSVRIVDSQSNWFGPARTIATKDESGNVVEYLSLALDTNNVWKKFYRTSYVRTGDSLEVELQEAFVNEQWGIQSIKTTHTKTTVAGIEIEQVIQLNFKDELVNNSRFFRLQNDEDVITKEIMYKWEDDEWVLRFYWEYEYNEQGDQEFYIYDSPKDNYTYQERWKYTYNAAMQPLTILREQTTEEPANWLLTRIDSFGYDAEGREILKKEVWPTEQRVRLEEIEYREDTIIWSAKQAHNGSPLEGLYRRWRVEGPEGYGQFVFVRFEDWRDGSWFTRSSERRTLSFDQYDKLIRVDLDKKVNDEWQAQSYQTYNWEYRDDGLPIKMVSLGYNYITEKQTPFEKKIWRYEDREKRSDRPMIEIAPNPSSGLLNIVFHTANALPVSWELLDETGRIVRTGELNKDDYTFGIELYIEELQSGLYILQVIYEDGRTVAKKWQKI